MQPGSPLLLASIDSVRPVFLIVMGVSLLLFAWRLSKSASVWAGRLLMAGAILLAIGYSVVLPGYEAGKIEPFAAGRHFHGDPAAAMAWHIVKIVSMNAGWLLFGWGVAIHAQLFGHPKPVQLLTLAPR